MCSLVFNISLHKLTDCQFCYTQKSNNVLFKKFLKLLITNIILKYKLNLMNNLMIKKVIK